MRFNAVYYVVKREAVRVGWHLDFLVVNVVVDKKKIDGALGTCCLFFFVFFIPPSLRSALHFEMALHRANALRLTGEYLNFLKDTTKSHVSSVVSWISIAKNQNGN